MNTEAITRLRAQCGGSRDGALLRFALGQALLAAGAAAAAATELQAAVGFDPHYSAAWKLLGKALQATGDLDSAVSAWRSGMAVAEARGDVQAAKEMRVFLRRVESAPR